MKEWSEHIIKVISEYRTLENPCVYPFLASSMNFKLQNYVILWSFLLNGWTTRDLWSVKVDNIRPLQRLISLGACISVRCVCM